MPEQQLFIAVLFRAVCDSLGFTNEAKASPKHPKAVEEARQWFYDRCDDFELICEGAGFDPEFVSAGAIKLIVARQTGDHTGVPPYWREVFLNNRMPSFSSYQKFLEAQKET